MDAVRELIQSSEPLLLFLVIGLGFLLGQLRFRGFKLGVAGVLFMGLFFGGWQAEGQQAFAIAHQIMQIGLILFVYAIGLTGGPGFFSSLKSRGLRFNIAVILALCGGAMITLVLGQWLGLNPGQIAGVFCGGLTNTPALAAVTELMGNLKVDNLGDAAVGYSLAYPFGILGGMLAFQGFIWVYRTHAAREKAEALARSKETATLKAASFKVSNPALFGRAIGELRIRDEIGLIVSRCRHDGTIHIPTKYSVLQENDVVKTVGAEIDIQKGAAYFGEKSTDDLIEPGGTITMRRILVSRKEHSGRTVTDLELDRLFNAQITRLRRADIDMIPGPDTRLEIGDRIRVVMPTERATAVAEFFGDSERTISEFDYAALTLGISGGVLLGMIPLPIPGGAYVSLGFAGGPLVAGLILGKLGRTGPLVWSMPAESNHTLRHIGLLFFLAAVGVVAGGRFFQALAANGVQLFVLGVLATTITTALTLLLLRHYGKATVVSAIGATCGMQTQPATVARAYEMSQSDETYVAYATTYPVAMVGKILLAQLVFILGTVLIR
jgi:putative transport protein